MGCDLHTEVERRTRFLMARVIPDKTAERSVGARLAMFAPLPAAARLSVTHDNGTGFARHARLRDEPGMATCFADPYSSWRRGGNENRNGMIRRYLPKRTIIEPGMARELQEIVDETDNRPMRALGYASARLPHTRRGVCRRASRLTTLTKALHLQIDNGASPPPIIGGSVQLNRVHFSVQLWTNEYLADV